MAAETAPTPPDVAARARGVRPAPGSLGTAGRGLLLLAVVLTGATSLAYEVAWTRGLVRVLGSTATTTTVVLAAFVGALGLGARWGGRRADRTPRPLRLYGLLEIGAAGWAVLALHASLLLLEPYAALAGGLPETVRLGLRALVAALVVAPGAFLLGATLPALIVAWQPAADRVGHGTAWVYGANTLGAVAGALLSGFWGIENLGVTGWLYLAAGVAVLVGGIAAVLPRRPAAARGDPVRGTHAPRLPLAAALGTAGLLGGLGLGLEVTGFRILVFFVEGFTATFAAMLGVFILGLGLGSLLLGPLLTRSARPDRWLAVLALGVSASVFVLGRVLVPELESLVRDVKRAAYEGAGGEAGIQAALRETALIGAGSLFLLPALLLGATFPLCVRWAELAGLDPGEAVGRVYLANSLGTMLGPFVATFLLVPERGLGGAWDAFGLLALGTAMLAGFGAAPRLRGARGVWAAFLLAIAVLTLVLAVPGDTTPSARVVASSHVLRGREGRQLLAVQTDAITTASVVVTGDGERILYTDDFAAAATGRHYRYMRLLGHLPVLLCARPEHVMVIAFGTGTTAGAVAAHEEVRRLEVVEVSPAVLELAPYFAEANRGVLADPRTRILVEDGRNALLLHAADLDVITLEPLMPYSPAGLPLYTREFYELARARLREGGVLCQWLPVHAMPAGLYAAFVRTFFEVFPEGSLWFFEQSTALLGWKGSEPPLDRAVLDRRLASIAPDMERAGLGRPDLLFAGYVASGARVLQAGRPPSPFSDRVVRDLDPFPEFHPTPRAPLLTPYLQETLEYLATLVDVADEPRLAGPDASRLRAGTLAGLMARRWEVVAQSLELLLRAAAPAPERAAGLRAQVHEARAQALRLYGEALARLPGEGALTWRHARVIRASARDTVLALRALATEEQAAGRHLEARNRLQLAARTAASAVAVAEEDPLASERADAVLLLADALLRLGRCEEALGALADGISTLPEDSRDRARLDRARQIAERHSATGRSGAFEGYFEDLPPCRAAGALVVQAQLERVRTALAEADASLLRQAARALSREAAEASVGGEVWRELTGVAAPTPPEPRAVWACLLRALEGADPLLGQILEDAARPEHVVAALREAAETRLLRGEVSRCRRLASAGASTIRATLADAIGRDGSRDLLRILPVLLLDAVRDVRVGAAAALARHRPDLAASYDADAPPPDREEAAAQVAAGLR